MGCRRRDAAAKQVHDGLAHGTATTRIPSRICSANSRPKSKHGAVTNHNGEGARVRAREGKRLEVQFIVARLSGQPIPLPLAGLIHLAALGNHPSFTQAVKQSGGCSVIAPCLKTGGTIGIPHHVSGMRNVLSKRPVRIGRTCDYLQWGREESLRKDTMRIRW